MGSDHSVGTNLSWRDSTRSILVTASAGSNAASEPFSWPDGFQVRLRWPIREAKNWLPPRKCQHSYGISDGPLDIPVSRETFCTRTEESVVLRNERNTATIMDGEHHRAQPSLYPVLSTPGASVSVLLAP
jgi:hypothetical protein